MNIFDKIYNIFLENPVWQTIGFIALIINIFAFVTSKDEKFLIFMAISSLVWWIHFYYLWLISAAYISFFDILKNIIALKYKKNKKLFIFLFLSYIIIWFFTFNKNEIFSVIPIINSLLSLFFIYFLKEIKLKIWFLIILFLWFFYNYSGNSIAGIISDTILILSTIIGIFNIIYRRKKTS